LYIVQEHLTGDEATIEVDVDVQMINGAEEGDEIEITIESESSSENLQIEDENILIIKDENGEMQRIKVDDMVIEMEGEKIIINGEEVEGDFSSELYNGKNGEVRILKKSFGIDDDIQKESKGFLGVYSENAENTDGVKITKVIEGSAAEEANLQVGDIVQKVNDTPINNMQDLINAVSSFKSGDQVNITLLRDNQAQTVAATLKSRKNIRHRTKSSWHQRKNEDAFKRGQKSPPMNCDPKDCDPYACDPRSCPPSMCVEEGTGKALLGVTIEDTDNNGSKIIEVQSETGAKRAGLLVDDVITKIEKEAITDADDLVDVIRTYEPGDKVKVHYLRNGKKGKVKVELGEKMMYRRKVACCTPDGNRMEKRIIIKKRKGATSEDTTAPSFESPSINNTLNLEDISLFPNPSNGNITVQFSTTEKAATTVSILDVSGKEVFKEMVQNFDGIYNQKIDLTSNAEGIYFLNIQQGDKIYTEQIVLNK